jgi:hypothetical protein
LVVRVDQSALAFGCKKDCMETMHSFHRHGQCGKQL